MPEQRRHFDGHRTVTALAGGTIYIDPDGFTSVFDSGSGLENTRRLRERIESGEVCGPRIRSTGEGLVPLGGSVGTDSQRDGRDEDAAAGAGRRGASGNSRKEAARCRRRRHRAHHSTIGTVGLDNHRGDAETGRGADADLGAVEYDPSEEYRLMSEAGMTFRQILASLTTAPAERFGESERVGRIEPGLQADIAVFKDDLTDIRYTLSGGQIR